MPEFNKKHFVEWLKQAISRNITPFSAIEDAIRSSATTVTEDVNDKIFRAQTAFMRWVSGDCT